MKMVMVTYNEAIDAEIKELLASCGLKNYTQLTSAFGQGDASGAHFGSDIWPGRNNIVYVACRPDEAQALMAGVRRLRKEMGAEGVKAFAWLLEEVT